MERKLLVAIEVFNQRFEIILVNLMIAISRFAFSIESDACAALIYDRLAELSANGSRWGFAGSVGPHAANLAHRIHAPAYAIAIDFPFQERRGCPADIHCQPAINSICFQFSRPPWGRVFLKDWQHGP